MANPLTDTVAELYGILEPLDAADRDRALRAALVLLGDSLPPNAAANEPRTQSLDHSLGPADLGPMAVRWITQNQISRSTLDDLFHVDGSEAVPIFSSVPGMSKREQTANCYLLAGVRRLIAADEAAIDDKEAVELCQQVGAYDKNNHTSNRKSLGGRVTGSRDTGFKLTVPGLREAARLVKMMASSNPD